MLCGKFMVLMRKAFIIFLAKQELSLQMFYSVKTAVICVYMYECNCPDAIIRALFVSTHML